MHYTTLMVTITIPGGMWPMTTSDNSNLNWWRSARPQYQQLGRGGGGGGGKCKMLIVENCWQAKCRIQMWNDSAFYLLEQIRILQGNFQGVSAITS